MHKYLVKIDKRGFSFVEVMVAVFLVSVGLLASLSLLTNGLRETMDSRNQLIASLLAQEGVELVRSVRDTNWANGYDSFDGDGVDTKTKIGKGDWIIAYDRGYLSSAGYQLKRSVDFYKHGAGSATKFFRKINVVFDNDANPTQATILSMVVWNGKVASPFTDSSGSPLTGNTCTTVNKCAFTEDTLTKWGE